MTESRPESPRFRGRFDPELFRTEQVVRGSEAAKLVALFARINAKRSKDPPRS